MYAQRGRKGVAKSEIKRPRGWGDEGPSVRTLFEKFLTVLVAFPLLVERCVVVIEIDFLRDQPM